MICVNKFSNNFKNISISASVESVITQIFYEKLVSRDRAIAILS